MRHCRREAERLGTTPPAQAMLAISEHAKTALNELPGLCEREGLPVSVGGSFTGNLFSELRDKLFDNLIECERSYRGTLLGARHGLRRGAYGRAGGAADAANKVPVVAFCKGWLTTRTVLVERAQEAMFWFAQHPDEAMKMACPLRAKLASKQDELH